MADIRPGDEISAAYWPAAVWARDSTANNDQTSLVPIAGTPAVNVTFVAPRSGRVCVCVVGGIDNDEALNRAFVSYELYLGTSAAGTLVQAARTDFGVSSPGGSVSDLMIHGNMSMVDTLTPGATYFARVVHWVEGGTTNDIDVRAIAVFPTT